MITITPRDVPGTSTLISTTFLGLAREVRPGSRILLSDGLIELRVAQVRGTDMECEVVNGGVLGEHKGINLPGAALSIPALTKRTALTWSLDSSMAWISWLCRLCVRRRMFVV